MSIPSDAYFIGMMETSWQFPENDHTPEVLAVIANLVKEVRTRAFALARNDPAGIKKLFGDFDTNKSGNLTIDETTNMIAKLKISVERKCVYPFFKIID